MHGKKQRENTRWKYRKEKKKIIAAVRTSPQSFTIPKLHPPLLHFAVNLIVCRQLIIWRECVLLWLLVDLLLLWMDVRLLLLGEIRLTLDRVVGRLSWLSLVVWLNRGCALRERLSTLYGLLWLELQWMLWLMLPSAHPSKVPTPLLRTTDHSPEEGQQAAEDDQDQESIILRRRAVREGIREGSEERKSQGEA